MCQALCPCPFGCLCPYFDPKVQDGRLPCRGFVSAHKVSLLFVCEVGGCGVSVRSHCCMLSGSLGSWPHPHGGQAWGQPRFLYFCVFLPLTPATSPGHFLHLRFNSLPMCSSVCLSFILVNFWEILVLCWYSFHFLKHHVYNILPLSV